MNVAQTKFRTHASRIRIVRSDVRHRVEKRSVPPGAIPEHTDKGSTRCGRVRRRLGERMNVEPRELKKGLNGFHLWGLAVGLVISGEYFGWSYGWASADRSGSWS